MWDAEDLGSHTAAELADFANDQIGLPVVGDREQVGNHPLGEEAREELPNPKERPRRAVRREGLELELKRDIALVGPVSLLIEARREHLEPAALNVWVKRRSGRKPNGMAVCLHGSRRRNKRMEVTRAGERREQKPHPPFLTATTSGAKTPTNRHFVVVRRRPSIAA
jgi:hypothetical protein